MNLEYLSSAEESLVLTDSEGNAYLPGDRLPSGETAYAWVADNVAVTDPLRGKFLQQYIDERFSVSSMV